MLSTRIIFVVLYLFVDILYVTIAHPIYDKLVQNIQHTKTSLDSLRIAAAVGAYACMAIGWYVLVAPLVEMGIKNGVCPTVAAIKYGLVFGLVIYGVFNFTNYVMFQKYSLNVLALDILWGITWVTSLTYLYAMYGVKR